MKKTASLLFFILILKNSLLGNLILSEIEAGNLIIEENSAAGTIIGKIAPVNLDSNKIKFSLKPTFPRGLSPKLWLDASDLNWAGLQWNDKSKNNNHGIIHGSANGYPSIKQNAHNGMSLMHYCGAVGSYHSFEEIKDIRTIFWVMRKKMGYSFMLGHDKFTHFHFNTGQFWWEKHASPHVLNGRLSINGNSIDGSMTDIPKDLSIISLRTTGDVTANNFSNDRNINARFFNGDLGELIIFNETLSDFKIQKIESYLHRKWNLPLAYEPILPAFAISTDGVISSNRIFDHESTPNLPIQVRVTDDSNSSLHLKLDVTISDVIEDLDKDGVQDPFDHDIDGDGVNNLDELTYGTDPSDPNSLNRPATNLRMEENASIIENQPAGTVAGRLLAEDPDGDELFFSVEGQNFTIEQNGTVRTARAFDHETSASVSVTLIATDSRGVASSATFSVSIRDLPNDLDEDGVIDSADSDRDGDGLSNALELANFSDPDSHASSNYAPVDLNSTTTLTIIENRPANTVVGKFSATDQESPSNLRFALTEGQGDSENGLFTLDANGTLRSLNPFDFENNATQHSIRVVVYDEQNASMERSFEIDLLDEDTFSPISLNRNLMLWLDASDRTTLDRGEYMGELGTPEDGNAILFWGDKSGNEHHAIRSSGSPTYLSEGLLGLPTLNTDGDELKVSDSNETFDELNEMTIFAVFKWTGTRAWKSLIAKNNSWNHTSFTLTSMNPAHLNQGTGTFYGLGNTYVRTNGGNVTDARDHPVALSLVYNGNTGSNKIFGNGVQGASSTGNPSRLLSNPEFDVKIGNYNLISEILIFNDALDDSNRERVEGYLAHKWNLLQELDEYHPYKNGGIMDGNAINISEELPIGTPIIQLSEVDPDYNASWSYSLAEANDSNDNELFSVFDPATFDPASLDNLALWLDANDSFTVNADQNGKVSIWHDKSGNANNVTQTDVNKMPTLTPNQLNARSVIQFDGINDFIMSSSLEITQSCFFAIVAKTNNHSSGRNFLFDGLSPATNTRCIIALNHESKIKLWANNWSNSNFDTPSDYFVMTAIFNSNNSSLSLNGTTASGLNPGTSSLTSGIRIGTHASLQDYLYGSIAEFLVVDDAVGTDTQSIVETYLANKWGLVDKLPVSSRFDKDFVQTATSLDYETNASVYNIRVRATANGAVQNEKNYKIYLSNVVEDMDGDGIEDHYDLDDDGDGFSDLIEIAYPSDPRDPDSLANVAPHLINFTGDLSVPENLQVGSQVTTFSATDDDGDSNFTYSIPKTIEKLEPVLWLDANHPSAKSSTWEDLSTYNRDAIRYNTPTVIENAQNGLSVMRYQARSSNTDYHEWASVHNIRTAFAVLKRNSGHILSHASTYHFHSNGNRILHSSHAKPNLRQGLSRLYGLEIDATATNFPNSQFIILSFVPTPTTGSISANRIGKDRNLTGNHFDGDYGELILFDKELEDWEIESVEYSLARKWGLESNLAESHFYKDANSTNGNDFFSIEENGGLTLAQPIDYETDRNFSITVRATDPHGASFDKRFTIEVTDIPEDLDGDGTPDHLDPDIDGDGLSNADELLGKSDPYNSNSTNRPPNAITSSNLSFTENLATGTKIGEFNATDLDGNVNLSFSLYPLLEVSPSLWLDGTDIDGNLQPDTYAVGDDISLWVDKSGNGYDFNETKGQPTYSAKEGKGVVKFDGQTMLWTGTSLYHDFNRYTIISVARYTGGKNGRIISDASNYNWLFGYHHEGVDSFYANGWLSNKRDIPVDQNWHLHVGTITSNDYAQGWVDQISMVDSPNGAGADYQPRLLALGGWRRSNTWFTDMSKAEVAELLVFDWVLNTSEIKQAEDYLIGKWNLPLPTGNSAVDFFEIDQNGTLLTQRAFNFETNDLNYLLRVRATDDYGAYKEEDFLIQLTNILEDADGNGVEDYEDNQSLAPTNIELSGGDLSVTENAELGTIVGQIRAIDPDGDTEHHYSLSISADHQRFHPSKIDGLTAWFDASDVSTISTYSDSSQLYTWRNKVDPDTYLRPNHGREPDANATINGLNAISFQKNDKQMEFVKGWKNNESWNPAGENGKISGANDDAAIFLIHQSKVSKKSAMPFGFGWSGHFLWHEGIHFDPDRISTGGIQVGKTHLIALYNSKTSNQRGIWVDGNLRVSRSPVSRNITGTFFFPDNFNESQDYASDCLLGEIMVIRGVMEERDHLEIEGYLAHKWGLADALPQSHMYSKSYGHFADSDPFLSIDKNGTIRTATTFDHEIDSNLTITIRATDDDGFSIDQNFTIMIENVQESDLDNDGIEDLIDDDIDGDGVSNTDEWKNNSDPLNPNSLNRAPTDIQASTISLKENKTVGSTILSFTNNDPDEGQAHRYQLLNNGKNTWKSSQLTDDINSGINSSLIYTCAVNINGSDKIINGVTFSGESGLSGTGWEITSGFQSKNGSQQSTVNGQIGDMLSDGMRFGGNPQKIKLTGLTIGKKYVFTLYSQGWGTETTREALISNSDSLLNITVNQNSYTSSTNDGILVECTYIASSTTTEFTISPMTSSTWHLYAFSNYEKSSLFTLNKNGHLSLEKTFDYETDEHSFPLTVKVTDDHNISFIKEFTLSLKNEIEDLDGDLIENHEDPDIDGDGVSNANEMLYGTDPWDNTSVNEPPNGWEVLEKLQIQENQPVGSLVGKIQGLDPQGSNTLNYSLIPQYPEQIKPVLWLDATDSSTFEYDEKGTVKRWENKIGTRHDFIQNIPDNRPSLIQHNLNNNNSVYFDGNDYMHSLGSINLGDNFSILMVAELEEIDSGGDALFSYNSNCEGGYFNFRSSQQGGFYGHYFSNETTGNNKVFFAQSQVGPALYELVFDLKQNFVQCFLNGTDKGKAPYTSAPGTHHIFRLFANLDISQHPKGSIGETLIFNSALPMPQRKEIESYLANKWNLTVDNKIQHHFFDIDNDGSIYSTKQFDYEKNENVSIKIRANDDYNMSMEKEFLISIENIIEDRDGDGIEDAYDFDFDNDGIVDEIDLDDDNDGITDLDEIIWGTNPFNQFSHAQVPIVRTLGYEENTTGYTLLGEIINNGGAPITELGIHLSYDINFHNFERIKASNRDGGRFESMIKDFREGTTLYFRVYGKNGVGLSYGGIKELIIKEFLISIENITEDRVGGGIEDAYDFDFDNDGIVDEIDLDDDNDGITDLDEIIWGTDPFNQFSHAQVPIVRTLGYEGNTTNGYALLGEIITNGGAPITDLGILLSYDMKFNNIEPIGSIERNGKKFKLLVENFRYGTVLYYKAYVKNGVGLSNGGIKKIIIPQGKENILLWTQAKKLADGWHTSSWFGSFLPYANGWLYHADLGWLYSHSGPTADLWLWSAEHGWLWTASGVYPYLFQNSSANWLYFLIKKDGVARFYDYTTKSFK